LNDLIQYGGFIAGIWVLSVFAIKPIRDSKQADDPTKDAAATAIIGMSIISTAAAAFLLGANSLRSVGGGYLGVLIFLIPFFAMIAVYWRGLGQVPDNEKSTARDRRLSNRKATAWMGSIFFVLAVVFLGILPATGAFHSFEEFPVPTPSPVVTAPTP
jgi:drug/metabolite transporter (DMT)-like permease